MRPVKLCRSRSWPGPILQWTILAIAADRAINEPRIDSAERGVVDAELAGDTRPEILDQDVGILDHTIERLAAGI